MANTLHVHNDDGRDWAFAGLLTTTREISERTGVALVAAGLGFGTYLVRDFDSRLHIKRSWWDGAVLSDAQLALLRATDAELSSRIVSGDITVEVS